jgi:arylsulfatase
MTTALFNNALYAANTDRPNVIIILVDDMGFSDLGCYGSEIETPTLDALARRGVSFTQFYNTGRCWPTRAALMTGFYAQAVNRDTLTFTDQSTIGSRPSWAPLLPALLKPAGYATFHSGKWHLDGEPLACGFDHSYQLLDDNRHFAPAQHRLDGADLPGVSLSDGYYSTQAITQRMLSFLKQHQATSANQPFFAYMAYIAPHFPLHAPQTTIKKYQRRYQAGWDQTRLARLERQQQLGLSLSSSLPSLEPDIGPPYDFPDAIAALGAGEVTRELPWDQLSDDKKAFQANKMAVHAAMIDQIDQQVEILVKWLNDNGALENTAIFFLSDNGASAEIMVRGGGHDPSAPPGSPQSYLCLGPGWSRCANTPFRRHKTWTHEGGISTPLIVHWPAGISMPGWRHQIGHVVSMVPTVLHIAGLPTSASSQSSAPLPYAGPSLLAAIQSNDPANSTGSLWWLHEDNKALRQGDYKIVKAANESWQLYDLKSDRIESSDSSAAHPDRMVDMIDQWERMTERFRAVRTNPDAAD